MAHIISTIILMTMMQSTIVFDFNNNSPITAWKVVDDVVMGGRSNGKFEMSDDGHGVFHGAVSLENNGGFSSIRYERERMPVDQFSKFIIRLHSDGKNYQFRVKTNASDYYSYVFNFSTQPGWQIIEMPFNAMAPSFRGRQLDQPNYPGNTFEELGFLIGNKKAENFRLLIDKIELE